MKILDSVIKQNKYKPYKSISFMGTNGKTIDIVAEKIRNEIDIDSTVFPARYQLLYCTKGDIGLKPGSFIDLSSRSVIIEKNVSLFELGKIEQAKREIEESILNSPYQVFGKKYEKDANGSYKVVDQRTFDCPFYVKDLEEASKWMLEINPSYYVGCTIKQDNPIGNGNTCIVAEPEYFQQEYGFESIDEIVEYFGNQYGVLVDMDKENDMSWLYPPEDVEEDEMDFFELEM